MFPIELRLDEPEKHRPPLRGAVHVLALCLLVSSLVGATPTDREVHVVLFEDAPLSAYRGGVPGLAATHPEAAGTKRLDPRGPASQAYLAWLDRRQDERLDEIAAVLGRRPDEVFRYRGLASGVALRLSAAEADRIRRLPGVSEVILDYVMPIDTDRGPVFIGASTVWSGAALGSPHAGEGVIVGVIDTGVNMRHPSFSDSPVDGYSYVNPLGSGNYLGWCDPSHPSFDPSYVCNDKLIGAWDMVDAVSSEADGPEDSGGHGSHTASIAAGNRIDFNGDGLGDMSGVAPHVSLITYDACYQDELGQGGCPLSATSAAADQALLDGVDVINYSISGGSSPWSLSSDRLFLNAVGAGIFVAAGAGNNGPSPGTVHHLGPWMATVAASQHDRTSVQNQLVNLGGGVSPPDDMTGWSRSGGVGPASIVYAAGYANGDPDPEQCLHPFPPGTWSGEIVLCDRGSTSRVMKGQNVLAGGAGGMVLANVSGGATDLRDDAHILPAIHVDETSGDVLRSWLASGSGHVATITPGVAILDPAAGQIITDFSSRGPNSAFDVLKPDVATPGRNIYAAYRAGFQDEPGLPPYEGLEAAHSSGTSMASPHTAGAAALVRSAHPSWTPAQIKSALMTTATTDLLIQDAVTPANPFDRGAGRVRFPQAVQAGLLLDETEADFLAADPALGGDPRSLNLASLVHGACAGTCAWTRSVESPLGTTVTWTASGTGPAWMTFEVTPSVFALPPRGEQELTIEVGTAGGPLDVWAFGEILLVPDDGAVPPAHFPVAVKPAGTPTLELDARQAFDTALGNGNGVVEPFEVFELRVDLRNTGHAIATGVSGILSSSTAGVTIPGPQAIWPDIPASQVGFTDPPHFRVEVGGTVACGTVLEFHLDVTTGQGPFPMDLQIPVGAGGPPAVCEPVPCRVEAAATATPGSVCSGGAVVVSADCSVEAGSDCSGTLEYRFEDGGILLQDWSTDPDVEAVPASSLAYALRVRDSGTLTESLAFTPVEVFPLPAPVVVQSPAPQCVEVGTLQLDAGPGMSSYVWEDGNEQVIGNGSILQTDCSVPGPIGLEVISADGCPGGASVGLECVICTPSEVSAPGAAVPFRLGVDVVGTVEFERLPDPNVAYALYGALSLADLLAGDYAYKFCDLEDNPGGTFQQVDAGTARWTPLAPSLIAAGMWVVIAESPPYESSYGRSSLGIERPPDIDGVGSVASLGCP